MGEKTSGVGHFGIPTQPAVGTTVTSGSANGFTSSPISFGNAPAAIFITGITVNLASTSKPTYVAIKILAAAATVGIYQGAIPSTSGATGTQVGFFLPIFPYIPVANAAAITVATGDSVGSLAYTVTLQCINQSNVVDDGIAVGTVTTVTNQLTAAQIATGVWQDTTAGDFTTASSIGKSLYTGNVAPGGANGLMISGANTGPWSVSGGVTYSNSGGNAFSCASSGSNGHGFAATGNGSGHGVIGAAGATGSGIVGFGGATSGNGIYALSQTSGQGLYAQGAGVGAGLAAQGGLTGVGLNAIGGATSGSAIVASATSGHGIDTAGAGTTKHGINATGGATTSHGINATGGGVGHGINATSGGGTTGDGFRATSVATNGNGLNLVANGTGDGLLATGGASAGGDGIQATAGGGVDFRGNQTGNLVGTVSTLTTYTGNTPQTGDAYARLGAPAGASVSADVAAVNAKTTNLPAAPASTTNITAGTITTVTNLTNAATAGDFTATMKTSITTAATAATPTAAAVSGAVGSVTGNVGGNVVGSVASVVADVGITQTGADKAWSTAARVLTAGTNIVLAKGTGLTGLNDIAATAIVSGGAITTSAGKVSEVTLVDTVTTYTGNTPQTGDTYARVGAAGAGLTAIGDTRMANLDAAVSSRLAAASYTAPNNSGISAIKAKTDQLGFAVAGVVDANVHNVNDIAVTGSGTTIDPWGP